MPRALVVMEDEAAVTWRASPPTARPIAPIATFPAMHPDIDQPATLREKAPVTAAR